MPIVTVYGIPRNYSQARLTEISSALKEQIAMVRGLGIETKDVTVFFPSDLQNAKLGHEIIIFIDLFPRETRTTENLYVMSGNCVLAIRRFFRLALIDCYPRFLSPAVSFSAEGEKNSSTGAVPCTVCGYETVQEGNGSSRRCPNCSELFLGAP